MKPHAGIKQAAPSERRRQTHLRILLSPSEYEGSFLNLPSLVLTLSCAWFEALKGGTSAASS